MHPTVRDILAALMARRMPIGNELAFQNAIATVLEDTGAAVQREYDLGPGRGRIDFYLRELQLGLELKVKGSPSDVVRQLQRYTTSSEIAGLVLVTGRARFSALPRELGGKPVHVAAVWRGCL